MAEDAAQLGQVQEQWEGESSSLETAAAARSCDSETVLSHVSSLAEHDSSRFLINILVKM